MHPTDPSDLNKTTTAKLHGLRALRLRVFVGIALLVALTVPLNYVRGFGLSQIVVTAVVGWIMAFLLTWRVFGHIIRLRQRTADADLSRVTR